MKKILAPLAALLAVVAAVVLLPGSAMAYYDPQAPISGPALQALQTLINGGASIVDILSYLLQLLTQP